MCKDQVDGFQDALHDTKSQNSSMLYVPQAKCECLRGCADLVVAGVGRVVHLSGQLECGAATACVMNISRLVSRAVSCG